LWSFNVDGSRSSVRQNGVAGGTGCTANTVLHLGWWWDSIIRYSHYDFDVDSFVEEPVLIVAQSGPRRGMDVASLDAFLFLPAAPFVPIPGRCAAAAIC
jgi:hypothetical protein